MIKILIVDDSAADRIIIENMLSNYKVYKASDGLEAFNILQEQPDIHLMILDFNMPKMNGFEVLKKIKEMPQLSLLRVIILTNYDEIDNEIMGLQLGAIDYIRKPIHINSLRARIEIHAELIKIQSSLKQQLHEKELTFEEIFNQSPMGISISLIQFQLLKKATLSFASIRCLKKLSVVVLKKHVN
ncbi:MAG: response regulator [Bacilli bacterium]|nr:response regulator [Bacilli bacterium]